MGKWPKREPTALERRLYAGMRHEVALRGEEYGALWEVVELIDMDDPRDTSAPEDAEVEALCLRHGYGAVMDAAARLWARRDALGAKTVGPCRATVQAARRLVGQGE
jgi:hypothetical protein